MFLTVKQRIGQKTTEKMKNYLILSFSQDIASSSGDSVSTSGTIGSSQKTSPVRAMSQLTVRALSDLISDQ